MHESRWDLKLVFVYDVAVHFGHYSLVKLVLMNFRYVLRATYDGKILFINFEQIWMVFQKHKKIKIKKHFINISLNRCVRLSWFGKTEEKKGLKKKSETKKKSSQKDFFNYCVWVLKVKWCSNDLTDKKKGTEKGLSYLSVRLKDN